MYQHRTALSFMTTLMGIALGATTASAQFETGFETPDYASETLRLAEERQDGRQEGQDDWYGFGGTPRVQTATDISTELAAAGLNPANPVRSGDQALFWVNEYDDPQGGFWRRPFTGLENETDVVVEWWSRPLTPGNGQAGTTIGQSLSNTFVGIQDEADGGDAGRAAAIRFGDWEVDGQTVVKSIDWASNDAPAGNPAGVWISSGVEWEADTWYNFQMHLDYDAKKYDFYIDGTKINDDPITFYRETATHAAKFFISRGTDQAGQIIDDIDIYVKPSGLSGDYNEDGAVNAADYVVWRDNIGAAGLPNDNNLGTVGQAQFDLWRSQFGATSGSPAAGNLAGTPVPEPATCCLLTTALGWGWFRRKWG